MPLKELTQTYASAEALPVAQAKAAWLNVAAAHSLEADDFSVVPTRNWKGDNLVNVLTYVSPERAEEIEKAFRTEMEAIGADPNLIRSYNSVHVTPTPIEQPIIETETSKKFSFKGITSKVGSFAKSLRDQVGHTGERILNQGMVGVRATVDKTMQPLYESAFVNRMFEGGEKALDWLERQTDRAMDGDIQAPSLSWRPTRQTGYRTAGVVAVGALAVGMGALVVVTRPVVGGEASDHETAVAGVAAVKSKEGDTDDPCTPEGIVINSQTAQLDKVGNEFLARANPVDGCLALTPSPGVGEVQVVIPAAPPWLTPRPADPTPLPVSTPTPIVTPTIRIIQESVLSPTVTSATSEGSTNIVSGPNIAPVFPTEVAKVEPPKANVAPDKPIEVKPAAPEPPVTKPAEAPASPVDLVAEKLTYTNLEVEKPGQSFYSQIKDTMSQFKIDAQPQSWNSGSVTREDYIADKAGLMAIARFERGEISKDVRVVKPGEKINLADILTPDDIKVLAEDAQTANVVEQMEIERLRTLADKSGATRYWAKQLS